MKAMTDSMVWGKLPQGLTFKSFLICQVVAQALSNYREFPVVLEFSMLLSNAPHPALRRRLRAVQPARPVHSAARSCGHLPLRLAAESAGWAPSGPAWGGCSGPRYGVRCGQCRPGRRATVGSVRCGHLYPRAAGRSRAALGPSGSETRTHTRHTNTSANTDTWTCRRTGIHILATGWIPAATRTPAGSRLGLPGDCPQPIPHVWALRRLSHAYRRDSPPFPRSVGRQGPVALGMAEDCRLTTGRP